MKPEPIFDQARKENRKNLTELESREILKHYRIPVVDGLVVQQIEDALAFADKRGYPLVLKVVSKDIIHKTDAGGVITGVKNEKELRDGLIELIKNIKKNKPEARIDGIFVQKMLPKAAEVIVGGKKDPTFGQVLLFGLGGVFVEVFNDVSFRVVPINEKDAVNMISEIKGVKVLRGARGQKPVDFKALVDILIRTSRMLEENDDIVELDINPVFALTEGAVAVDARIIID
ncbi:MAG: acetyl-CoA synthetase [Candidatus Aenigmarchaeota archaeon CG_4_9_14_3_um_filter_37_18]|nr:MAG: acetyl-CoA synthetase [Candidatus Aenigmarchaeota archaeon CG_4_9_14_3_um_filter_37_18]